MKNYVQESLRYLREKAQEHEKELRCEIDVNQLESENTGKNDDEKEAKERNSEKNNQKVSFI
jgi:hypothetical protein